MAPPRKRAGDLTGIETERLQKEHAAELKQRAQEISMMAEVQAELDDIPVDYSDGKAPVVPTELEPEEEIILEKPTRVIIPNTKIEQMTWGAGNHLDFEEGRKYNVPVELARHLESKGLLYNSRY